MARRPQQLRNFDNRAKELGLHKLKTSGLTEADGVKLSLEYLGPVQTKALHDSFQALPALRIPYFTIDGKPAETWPKRGQFYRLRYLEAPIDFNTVAGKKAIRYVQEPKSGVAAYFPAIFPDWPAVAADHNIPIIITEGEFKAAKACKVGFPTIGLGGVWNWRSNQDGFEFLPELEVVKWAGRTVYIVFDSDFKNNADVCQALNTLAEQLMKRGAYPHYVPLPDLTRNEAKTGLDDFLVAERDPAKALETLISSSAQGLTFARALWKMNEKVVLVFDPGLIVDITSGAKFDTSKFVNSAYAQEEMVKRVVDKEGNLKMQPVSVASEWLKWPLRRQAARMTYAPGKPQWFETERGVEFNIWPGWGCEPKPGDTTPFLELVDHVFKGAEREAIEWFLDWCAYPLQYPGVKMFSSVMVHGRLHGTGKSQIGYSLGRIYARNFSEINHADLHAGFNEWAENKQFVMGDDVTGSNKRSDADVLKKMITQLSMRVNVKYLPSYTIPDCINYYFTSNHPDAFFLEDDDRRTFVHELTCGKLSELFYTEYAMWLDSGGASHLFQFFLDRDLTNFNPASQAYRTKSRSRMILDVKSDIGAWVELFRVNMRAMAKVGNVSIDSDIFSPQQLLAMYDPTGRTGTTANGLALAFKRAGFHYVAEGAGVKGADGFISRYLVVRNFEHWSTATTADAERYLQSLHNGGIEERKANPDKYRGAATIVPPRARNGVGSIKSRKGLSQHH